MSSKQSRNNLLPGTLNLLVLKCIGDGEFNGVEIQERIESQSGFVFGIEEGSLYPSFHRMANQGLIAGDWRVTEKKRRAKYYRMTPKGKKELERAIRDWRRCSQAIERVLNFA